MLLESGKEINVNLSSNKFKQNPEKSWPQIIAVFAVSLGSLTNGIMYSWSSPFALVITKDKDNYTITEEEASYFIVAQPVGMVFASLFFFKIAELIGRKTSVLFLAVPHLICWILIIVAKTKWEFYASRFFAGVGDAVLFSSIPPYVAEVTTPTIRGYFGNLPLFCFNGGSVLITVLGSYCDVKTTSYICIGFPLLFVIFVFMLPESPYQLIRDGKLDDARKSIQWFRRKPDIEEDFLRMKTDVERQMSERGKWKDLIKIKSNRKALYAGIFIRFSQQFSGVTVFGSYTQTIFEKAGGSIKSQYSSMIFVGLFWIVSMLCSAFLEKIGRRLCYFYSLLSCGFILVIMSVFFFLEQYEIANLSQVDWFPLGGMILYVFTFNFGLGIVPTLILGELFSESIKVKALSACTIVFGIIVFFTSYLFNLLTLSLGLYSPFLVYGLCCLISTIFTLYLVPETKGKTLEEIQQDFKK